MILVDTKTGHPNDGVVLRDDSEAPVFAYNPLTSDPDDIRAIGSNLCSDLNSVATFEPIHEIKAMSDSVVVIGGNCLQAAARGGMRARRERCGIPKEEGHRPKWTLAVEMLDELAEHGLRPPVLVAAAGYGDNGQFRAALDKRDIAYSVQLKGDALAHTGEPVPVPPVWSGTGRCGRPPADTPVYADEPVSLARHVAAADREAALTITWREGSKGRVVLAVRVPAGPARRAPRPSRHRGRHSAAAMADRRMARR